VCSSDLRDCTIRNFPASNPLDTNFSFKTQPGQTDERWLVIFDNVVHTGQMSCNLVAGHIIWFTNGSSTQIQEDCQNLLIPVDGKVRVLGVVEAEEEAERAKKFKHMLNGATLTGTWQMTTFDDEQRPGKLTAPKPETYTISEVSKASDDYWLITARIQYADKDVQVPIMVRVVWSGDTPVITVDNLTIPMIGPYTARVMVYRDFYAGTWFGRGYGGVLSGQITKTVDKDTKDDSIKPHDDASPENQKKAKPIKQGNDRDE